MLNDGNRLKLDLLQKLVKVKLSKINGFQRKETALLEM